MMKPFLRAVALALASTSAVQAAPSALEVAEGYMTAVIKHDQAAASRLVVSGSQADTAWRDHSASVSRLEKAAPGAQIGFRKKVCFDEGANTTVCNLVLTRDNRDGWLFAIQVQRNDMKIKTVTMSTPRTSR